MAKKTRKKLNLTMPDPWVVLSTWIKERVEHVAQTRWSPELTEWAICAWNHAHANGGKRKEGPLTNHYNEPPIPVVIGFIAEAAANHKQGASPNNVLDREKLALSGDVIAKALHGNPQPYMNNTECPRLPYPIPVIGRANKSESSKAKKARATKRRK